MYDEFTDLLLSTTFKDILNKELFINFNLTV